MSGKYNIVADQGATFNLKFRVETSGVAWDLSNYTARMQVSKSTSSTTRLLNLTTENGDITLNSSGQVFINTSATNMAKIPTGRWVYEIELTSAGGEVTRILEGRFIISPEVK
jgi:hypothetical protein